MWSLEGAKAQLHSAPVSADLDVRHPQRGLANVQVALGEPRPRFIPLPIHHWFQISDIHEPRLDAQVTDSYVRGNDLVASFSSGEDGCHSWQAYWRFLWPDAVAAAGIEFILSVQTSLLNSDPSVVCQSLIEAEEILELREGLPQTMRSDAADLPRGDDPRDGTLVLFRFAGTPYSYAEMVHPGDVDATTSLREENASAVRSSMQLFPGSLEKGVIRRVRLRGYFVMRDRDTKIAKQLFQAFAVSAPPLTT